MIRFINFENKLFSEASRYIDSILHIVRDISTTSLHSFPIFSGFDLREKTNESGLYLILVTHRKVLRCLRINNTKIKPILLLLLQLWDISDFLSSFLQFSLIEHMLKSSIRDIWISFRFYRIHRKQFFKYYFSSHWCQSWYQIKLKWNCSIGTTLYQKYWHIMT